VPVPVSLLVVAASLLAFGAWSLIGRGPVPVHITLGPVATPTAAPTPSPTPSPTPTIAPDTPAYVTGTASSTEQSHGQSSVVIDVVTEMDDPRVTGTGTYQLVVNSTGQRAFASGTFRLEAAGGAWEGTCTGARWDGFTPFYDGIGGANLSCWLRGSGAFTTMTLYLNHRFAESYDARDELLGTIVPAEPPSP
jgi:hypothetical protein